MTTYTVILKRGPKTDVIKHDATEQRAHERADALLDLHGLNTSKMTYDFDAKTFTVDASEYYKD